MAIYRYIPVNIPEAELLADLEGIRQDLLGTIDSCEMMLDQIRTGSGNVRLIEALSIAALIRYARSFSTGVRVRIPKSLLEDLSQQQCKDHEFFMNMRDKHIAHSVNSYEENEVDAYLVPEERGPRGVHSISVQHRRVVAIGGESAMTLKALSSSILKRVESLMETERAKVMAALRVFPIDDLYGMEARPVGLASPDDVSKPRRKKK